MRRLLLFRHAKAERAIAGAPDRERPLNERGLDDAGVIGAYMATHALTPDRVLISPAARTQKCEPPLSSVTPATFALGRLGERLWDVLRDLLE